MAIYALTGNDTLVINGRVLTEFADQSTVTIEFGNARVGHTTGKNGNTIISEDKQGENATLSLRIIAGSSDDTFLNGLSVKQADDLPSFALMTGTFAKRIGNGLGGIKNLNYSLRGGVFENNVNASENLQGDNEQAVAIYTLWFSKAERGIA